MTSCNGQVITYSNICDYGYNYVSIPLTINLKRRLTQGWISNYIPHRKRMWFIIHALFSLNLSHKMKSQEIYVYGLQSLLKLVQRGTKLLTCNLEAWSLWGCSGEASFNGSWGPFHQVLRHHSHGTLCDFCICWSQFVWKPMMNKQINQ